MNGDIYSIVFESLHPDLVFYWKFWLTYFSPEGGAKRNLDWLIIATK